jgi:hypothetical protein
MLVRDMKILTDILSAKSKSSGVPDTDRKRGRKLDSEKAVTRERTMDGPFKAPFYISVRTG